MTSHLPAVARRARRNRVLARCAGAAFAVLAPALLALPAAAAPAPAALPATGSLVTPVAQGCGIGYWRGPWGHCRDTPYHGRLPDGGWQ